ncbi:MAG: hypothetical protein JO137_12610 [Hyphomicrobiales bacterium]|nr:hypothetical protein [Hyphomicrobiales bacterium]MBV9432654.1 hypothetical protein [Hyphomicrobiales bacterium]
MLPEPKPGLVIRYDYLWVREAATGQQQGKDRPACLVAASDAPFKPRFVVILAITHTKPAGDTIGIEIPARVRQSIGLDDAPCWVIISEYNVDIWPNGGLSPVPGRAGAFSYGFIPPGLFAQIKENFLKRSETASRVQR